jgi:tRNA dimethylallyltransferase
VVVMTGGSMLYADAVCKGLDDLPAVPEEIRKEIATKSLEELQHEVQRLDPDYWQEVDQQNPARLAHCIEICITTGKPYSTLRTQTIKERPFRIIKIGLTRPRALLYARIDERVKQMIANGMVEEARRVYPQRALNSLQTVGYKELFAYFDGDYDLHRAIELIQQNTRHYAKRQMTWFRRDKEIHWLNADEAIETNIENIEKLL